jgi:hypothetical protein
MSSKLNSAKQGKLPPASLKSPPKSPRKKIGKIPTRKDNVKANGPKDPVLKCYGFPFDLPIEAYLFCKDVFDTHDGFLNGFKQFVDGKCECDALTEANFTAYKGRRVPHSATNEIMLNGTTKYWRVVMLRYVPERISTPETRAHGLQVLKTFLNSTQNTNFPVPNIITMDNTKEEDPDSLDTFFLDNDIEDIIREAFEEDDLNQDFYATYPILAEKLWSGPPYPEYARSLGYPS